MVAPAGGPNVKPDVVTRHDAHFCCLSLCTVVDHHKHSIEEMYVVTPMSGLSTRYATDAVK